MNEIPTISESTIRQHASGETFSRGEQYYRQGAVSGLMRRGGVLQAEVEGSEYAPYRVRVAFDSGGITSTSCTCPYDWGGWCKHIVATLLAMAHEPEAIEPRPALEELLAGLTREQLQALLSRLATRHTDLADEIELELALLAPPGPAGPAESASMPSQGKTRRVPIDTQTVRRQIRMLLRPSRYSYDYGYADDLLSQVREVVRQAERFSEGGDGNSALLLLEAITDEYAEAWFEIDQEGELGGFFDELAEAWAEALLSAELTPAERRAWAKRLKGWQREAEEYGAGDELEIAQLAAEQGWDEPQLQRVLQGEITEKGAWAGEPPAYADELAQIRLKVLERQGRLQEYLYLAEAEGQIEEYLIMLARMGRVQEAVDEGLMQLATANEAMALATVLREQGALDAAAQVAEHGMTLAEPRGALAAWLSDLAEGLGRRDLALRAAELAFRSNPSLAAYLKVHELAGEDWPALQQVMLDHLRTGRSPWSNRSESVDIFLHEGLLDDAIDVVKDGAWYDLLGRVVDAAIAKRPDWAIEVATRQAEQIMDAGEAKHYDHAVNWLRRARDAYQGTGRQEDWQKYVRSLRDKHGRKYKLMGLMQGL